jgi:zinc-ribbon domain
MRCSSCGSENREGRKFCAGCGAALTLACAAMRTGMPPRSAKNAEADAWLEMTGAKSYEPFLHIEHAELARLTGDETRTSGSFARRIGCSSR